jgi:autotransporter-associated beta strand protein
MFASATSPAADGSWNADADGNWSDTANWLGNVFADGAGSTAYFTNEVTAVHTVTLDSARTVGNLVFSDADSVGTPEAGWILAGSSTLTLSNSAATPVINVHDLANTDGTNDAKITAVVSSEQGFVKKGTNTLYLGAANIFNAPVQLEDGLVAVGNAAALGTNNREVVFNGGGVGVVSGVNYGNTNNVISTGILRNLSGANYDGLKGPWIGSSSAVMNIFSGNRFTMDMGNASMLSNFAGTICLSNSPSGCLLRINMGGGPYDMSAITLDTGTGAGRFATRITSAANGVWKIGALKGAGGQLCGSENSGGTMVIDEVGYLNTDTTFGGAIRPYGSGREVTLTKVGTGKLTLTGTSTYAGNTIISNGVLALSGGGDISTSPLFNIMANGKFDVAGLDPGTWSPTAAQTVAGTGAVIGNVAVLQGTIAPGVGGVGTLSFSNNLSLAGTSVTTNLFKVGAAGNDKIYVAGDLTVSEMVIVRVVPTGVIIPNGTYTLMKCTGTLTADLANMTLEYPAQTGTLTLGVNTGTKEVYLTVSGVASAANLKWLGNVDGQWDFTTANWLNGGVASLFTTGDNVTFDNTSTRTAVDLAIEASAGSVVVNATKDYVFDTTIGTGKITGTGSLLKTNTGTLTLVTDNDYIGTTTILGGNVIIGDGISSRGKLGTGAITNNGTVTYNRPDDVTVADTFYGTGNLVKVGPNTITMSGVNNCAGGITISNGIVAINSYGALSSNTVVMAGGQLTIYPAGGAESGLAGQVNVVDNSTVSYASSGTYACVFTGPLTGTSGKMLTLTPTSGSSSRVRVYSTFTYNADLNLSASTMFLAPYNNSGVQMYNGVVSGPGTILVRCNGGQVILNNAGNTYSGGTMLSQGSIGVGADSVLSEGNIVSGPLGTGPIVSTIESATIGSCTLFANGGARTIANPITYDIGANLTTIVLGGSNNLTLSGAMSLNGNDGGINERPIEVNNPLSTLSGVISDGGLACILTKRGNGILVLEGVNTYTGTTYVGGGTLLVNGQIDVGGVIATNSNLGGTGTILGPVTVGAAANLAPGNSAIGTLTVNNNLTLAGGLMIEVNKSLAQSSDLIAVSGTLNNTGTGTVVVTNLGATALATGDKFQLFNKAMTGGGTMAITGGGMSWSNRLALDGSIVVLGGLAPTIPTTPTNVVYTVSGGNLTLSWPDSYIGWDLQSNSVSVASTSMWFTVTGSAATNRMILPVDTTKTNVFYRMHYLIP